MTRLLIVESPSKAKHITEMLGKSGWVVKASLGHIRDLPVKGDAAYVRPPNFKMQYEITDEQHEKVVQGLKAQAKSADGGVYIATDPDREGEAIGWHLCRVLGLDVKTTPRVKYHEVTETAIRRAIDDAGRLDMRLIAAQEARRALDRMVGWEVSGPLSRAVGVRASAGRVQTPALRLIVERERKIMGFRSTGYFEVYAVMPGVGTLQQGKWRALWDDGLPEGQYFQDADFADRLVKKLSGCPLVVLAASAGPSRQSPPPPYTTSSMQMDASRRLKWPLDQVMKAAQSLFEQGYITYHRTDSPNLSEEGESLLRSEAAKRDLPLSKAPRRWKAKGDAQEAHEAIRPTFEHEGLPSQAEDRALYEMILNRAMASQLEDAVYRVHTASLDGGEMDGKKLLFKASGKVMVSKGWKALYEEGEDEKDGTEDTSATASNPVPDLSQSIGKTLNADGGEQASRKTHPPKRYTQATLVAELEKHGVGRPSTYASIIQTLLKRLFVQMKKQEMAPTDLGMQVTDALAEFDFAGVDYTRDIESTLDNIAQGQARPHDLLQKVYDGLYATLQTMPGESPGLPCPVDGCQGQVRRMESKKKKGFYFWGCSAVNAQGEPAHGLLSDDNGKPGELMDFNKGPAAPQEAGTGPACPKCRKPTNILKTRNDKPYFKCFPCKNTWWPDKDDEKLLGKKWD